jgi:hypothetical protein
MPAIFLALCTLTAGITPHTADAFSSTPGQCDVANFVAIHEAAQVGNGGFEITVSSTTYEPGQPLTITLSHPTGGTFRGLLLYGFDASAGPDRVGSFLFPAGYAAVSLGCPGDPNGTLGQTDNSVKATPVDFIWTPPSGAGSVTFVAMVVVDLNAYYVLDPIVLEPALTGLPDGDGNPTAGLSLQGASPNPFQGSTLIRYSLGNPAATTVRFFDVLGHVVGDLPMLSEGQGVQARRWDGRDGNGAALPSGVYFYRVEAGQSSAVGKVVIRRN